MLQILRHHGEMQCNMHFHVCEKSRKTYKLKDRQNAVQTAVCSVDVISSYISIPIHPNQERNRRETEEVHIRPPHLRPNRPRSSRAAVRRRYQPDIRAAVLRAAAARRHDRIDHVALSKTRCLLRRRRICTRLALRSCRRCAAARPRRAGKAVMPYSTVHAASQAGLSTGCLDCLDCLDCCAMPVHVVVTVGTG